MKDIFTGLRTGLSEAAPTTNAAPPPSLPALAWNRALFTEHVRHTGRLYLVLGIAGVCASPVVYAVAYGCSRQNRAALIDAAATLDDQSAASSAETTTTRHGRASASFGTSGGGEGNRPYEQSLPLSDEEADAGLVVSAASRAVAMPSPNNTVASRSRSTTASSSSPSAVPVSPLTDRLGYAQGRDSALARLSKSFCRTVLSVKHASNHVFGTTCARAVLPPYYAAVARHVVRGVVVNLAAHALVFGVCALLDACLPLSVASPVDGLSAPADAPSTPGSHVGLWRGLQQLLSSVWTGLCTGRGVLSAPLAPSPSASTDTGPAAAASAPALPLLAHTSWTSLYDFVTTTRFAPIGYWSIPLMRVCAVWWCLSGRSDTPWQRTDRPTVVAAATTWHRLSPCGLFLAGVLSALQTRARRLVMAHGAVWRRHRRQRAASTEVGTETITTASTSAAEKEAAVRDDDALEADTVPVKTVAPPASLARAILCHDLREIGQTLSTCVVHGLALVVADYALDCLRGGAGRMGVAGGGQLSPPAIAILFSVLSLH